MGEYHKNLFSHFCHQVSETTKILKSTQQQRKKNSYKNGQQYGAKIQKININNKYLKNILKMKTFIHNMGFVSLYIDKIFTATYRQHVRA